MANSYNKLSFAELKDFLDHKYEQYCNPSFLPEDPLGLVHEFSKKEDQEIIGFFLSTIAWGNRKSIIQNGKKLIALLQGEPHNFILNHSDAELEDLQFIHRTFQTEDLRFFIRQFKRIYTQHNSLEDLFLPNEEKVGNFERISAFRKSFFGHEIGTRTEKHVANPERGSAAKRINMYLRWMVRDSKEGVDLGVWKRISKAGLCLPLDVHTGNVARQLGILQRKQSDWKALEELMKPLRKMDPSDPCKYDFALFGVGVNKELF